MIAAVEQCEGTGAMVELAEATIDVAPEMLGEFAPIIGRVCQILGSAECSDRVRLRVLAPAEFGPRMRVIAHKTPHSLTLTLESER